MNFLREKYKSFEEGLAAYLEWEESMLERYDRPATELDKEMWTKSFKRLWEKEELHPKSRQSSVK